MKAGNISAVQKIGVSRKILFGALMMGAVLGLYFNLKGINLSARPVTRTTFAAQDVFTDVSVNRKWILIGSEFNRDEKTAIITARLSASFLAAHSDPTLIYTVEDTDVAGKMDAPAGDNGFFTARIDAGGFKPGKYFALVEVKTASAQATSGLIEFNVSYPLYLTWTLDWEGYDVSDEYLKAIDEIAESHKIPVTHFFNPRIYTSSAIAKSRADYLTSWVIERKTNRGDAIGLHLHMFPDMVKAAGVEPHLSPAWGSTLKDGYDILTSAYTYEKTVKMLQWSRGIFVKKGLGVPTMFRAGGWFADEETLKALEDTGFVLDSSGRTKYSFGTNGVKGPWDLSAQTRPYRPNSIDQNSAKSPALKLWEFPNNGGDSWTYSQDEMYARFKANFSGSPLWEKQVVTYLSHPEWFSRDNPKVRGLFSQTDKYLNSKDAGPVIYITLEEAFAIWAGL